MYDSIIHRETHREEKKTLHIVALLLLAKMTNLNLVYTAIERVTAKRCSEMVTASAWTYFGVYCLVFLSISVYKMWSYDNKERRNKNRETQGNATARGNTTARRNTCTCFLAIVIGFFTSVFAAFYILADNRLLLACSGKKEVNPLHQEIARLVLWMATLFFGGVGFVFWRWYVNKKRYVKAD